MTIMEKNAIWFIVFLEISLDKFIWDGKCQRAEVRRMFLGVCSLGNYGIVMNRIGVDENIMKRQRRENEYETRKTD